MNKLFKITLRYQHKLDTQANWEHMRKEVYVLADSTMDALRKLQETQLIQPANSTINDLRVVNTQEIVFNQLTNQLNSFIQ